MAGTVPAVHDGLSTGNTTAAFGPTLVGSGSRRSVGRTTPSTRVRPAGIGSVLAWAACILGFGALHAADLSAQDTARPLTVTFFDVGQGDAVLVRAPEGQSMLVDTGWGGVPDLLRRSGVTQLDLLVSSHPHADHIGGTLQVLNAVPVRFYMDNGQPHTTATYRRLMSELERRPDITYLAAEPRTITLGSANIEVLPLPALGTVDHNNRSVGLVITFGDFSVFLSGDSERRELDHFVALGVVPDVTVLKAPHHGSDNGFTMDFLQRARPEVVVISVGPNSYGHPRASALAAYASIATSVYRTDENGEVTVSGYRDGSYEIALGRPQERPRETRAISDTTGPSPSGRSLIQDADNLLEINLAVFPDAPGNDHENLNGEYVIIRNQSPADLDVGNWTLCDAARHCFRFPTLAAIPSGQAIVVFTGSGISDGVSFYMNRGAAVWNNDGDTASLTDEDGRLVAVQAYE